MAVVVAGMVEAAAGTVGVFGMAATGGGTVAAGAVAGAAAFL
jgi:hypothetical protein